MSPLDRRRCIVLAGSFVAAQALPQVDTPGHERFMRRAIALAANNPKYPFGALLVDAAKDSVVAEGWNRSAQNPVWHGEIDAINQCAAKHPSIDWTRLILYTTAEPCPMCQSAVAWAGIGMVVFGSSIPYLESLHWSQINIRAEEVARRTPFRKCAIIGGILETECNALFRAAAGR
jgi:tRNA(adenine34) deaminase